MKTVPSKLITLALAATALAVSAPAPAGESGMPPAAVPSDTAQSVPLIEAVRTGDVGRVRRLLRDNADVNVSLLNGYTALHMAARTGNEVVARLLIRAGADVNATAMGNRVTPLHVAAQTGHLPVVRLLLSAGAAIDQPTVAAAVVYGRDRVVETLLKHGANIERRDAAGDTYLHLAVLSGRVDMVNLLVRYGAKVDAKDGNGLTPLSLAVGDEAVTAALRGNGAKDAPPPDWETLVTIGNMAAERDDDKSAAARYELALTALAGQPADKTLAWRLTVLQKLARAYFQGGRLDKARQAAGEFVRDFRDDAGIGRLSLAGVRTLLGRIDLEQGDLARAEQNYRTAADIYEAQPRPDTAALTDAYLRLANALIRQHRYHRAQTVFEKARRVLQADGRADPLILAMTEQNLAHALRFQGKLDEAKALYKHAGALLAKAPGADSGMAAGDAYGLAEIARQEGRLSEAVTLYRKAIDAFESSNSLSPSTLAAVKRRYRTLRRKLSGAAAHPQGVTTAGP